LLPSVKQNMDSSGSPTPTSRQSGLRLASSHQCLS
jgi:hypothetical protein